MQKNRTGLSLFSGVGGLDCGFLETGVSIVEGFDVDADARTTYARNFGVNVKSVDVRTLRGKDYRGVDVVLAGPPCQGFSSLRKRGLRQNRNGLFRATAQLIADAKPSMFVIENVRGLRWHRSGRFLQDALAGLRRARLIAEVVEVECCYLNVPQVRRRILLIGGRGRSAERFADEVRNRATDRSRMTAVGDVLRRSPTTSLPPPPTWPSWYVDVMRSIGPGQKLCDTRLARTAVHSWNIPSVFGKVTQAEIHTLEVIARIRRVGTGRRYARIGDGQAVTVRQISDALDLSLERTERRLRGLAHKGYLICPRSGYFDLSRKFNGRFRRLDPCKPSPAVLADFGSPRSIIHPYEDRGLSVSECAALQGFPSAFEFAGTTPKRHTLIANAVPPPISRLLAEVWARTGA
jgi:DNA (cytosine-5)-methyltransferase 1